MDQLTQQQQRLILLGLDKVKQEMNEVIYNIFSSPLQIIDAQMEIAKINELKQSICH